MISKIISTNPAIMADEIQRLKEGSKVINSGIDFLAETGVKNLVVLPYVGGTSTHEDVTFTCNDNGSISTSGTASADYTYVISQRTTSGKVILPNGKYILSGISGGSELTYYLSARTTKGGVSVSLISRLNDGEAVFEVDGDDTYTDKAHVGIYLSVKKNAVMTDKVFWPMIRPYGIESDKFVLPAKTNLNLSSDVDKLLCDKTTAGSYYLTATVDSEGAITYSWEVIE